jgi:hypothetical protein
MAITNKEEYKSRLTQLINSGHSPFDETVVRELYNETQEGNLSDESILEALRELFPDHPFITQNILNDLRKKYNLS